MELILSVWFFPFQCWVVAVDDKQDLGGLSGPVLRGFFHGVPQGSDLGQNQNLLILLYILPLSQIIQMLDDVFPPLFC